MVRAQTLLNTSQRLARNMATPTVNFMSYNSTGISSSKCDFINNIFQDSNIFFASIQEHFKSNKNTQKYFNQQFQNMNSYVIPGFREQGQDNGRAKAGLAQLNLKGINVKRERISTKSFRIQSQILNFPSCRLLWINAYLPTDPQTIIFDDKELAEVLSEIESIIRSTQYNYLILNGDLNYDKTRQTGFVENVMAFTNRVGLIDLWDEYPCDFTHIHTDFKSTSVLDCFLVSENLLPLVKDCRPLHLGQNLSRHSPILLCLDLGKVPKKMKQSSWLPRKPSWLKATEADIAKYKSDLQSKLEAVNIPHSVYCSNPHCDNTGHSVESDTMVLDILCSMVETSYTALPLAGGRKASNGAKSGPPSGKIPGWRKEVEPHREEARFWFAIWVSAGKPKVGELYHIMCKTKNIYHYMIRKIKRKEQLMRAKKLFEASISGDIDLMKEMKNIRNVGKTSEELPDNVEGACGEEEIVVKFKTVYASLYNSAGTEKEMEDIKARIAKLIKSESICEVMKITGDKVKEAVNKMEEGKSDVSGSFTSNALSNAPDLLFDMLASVYRSWLIHGTVTNSVLACAFLLLLKNSLKDPSSTTSYRAIAGSTLLLKLFDKVVLLLWGHLLKSETLQFGYKAGTGTTQCSWLLMEVIGHYLRAGNKPILTLLDCSRAFDVCRFSTIFTRLMERNLPAIVIRTLITVYTEQYAWVRWGKSKSNIFTILNGTRQGSVLSAAVFSMYVEPLLEELRARGLGCHVAGVFMGAMGYCDDVALVSPSRDSMQEMLVVCENFAARTGLTFSTDPNPNKSKTKCIFVCGRQVGLAKPAPLYLNGKILPWVSSATHLGHEIHESGSMEHDSKVKRAKFISDSVDIRETFSFANPVEILRAVKVYCSALYGAMLWDLGGSGADMMFKAWNTCVKLTWQVPRATRSYFVDQLLECGLTSLKSDTVARYTKYLQNLPRSPSAEVVIMFNVASRDIRSQTGANIKYIEEMTGLNPKYCSVSEMKKELSNLKISPDACDAWRIEYLRKLLSLKCESHYRGDDNTTNELNSLINSLCIN